MLPSRRDTPGGGGGARAGLGQALTRKPPSHHIPDLKRPIPSLIRCQPPPPTHTHSHTHPKAAVEGEASP